MATWVARSLAAAPFPLPKARSLPDKLPNCFNSLSNINVSRPISLLGDQRIQRRDWRVGVSAPARPVPAEDLVEDHKPEEPKDEKAEEFDPGMPPPFRLAEIRAAIPKRCWVRDPWKSVGYVVRDVVAVLGVAFAAAYVDHWVVWPLYWAAQGTMFWALFVLGHDWYGSIRDVSDLGSWFHELGMRPLSALVGDLTERWGLVVFLLGSGHGSFSTSHKLNSVVGHLLHSSILVPYHGWRISHRTHHQFHGHVEKDESWTPITKNIYKSLDCMTRKLRFTPPLPLFAFPLYLFLRTPGKAGNHFDPDSDLFVPSERKDVLTSTACLLAMVGLLGGLTWALGPIQMFKLYFMPYMVFVMWLDFVTYLHHHGHDDDHRLPWYRGKEWSYLRGGLSTLDHDYGWINNIHHDIGTHVIHHLFPQIPHYHLVEATKAARPVLGKYYIDPKKSGPLPFHLFGVLTRSLKRDHFVNDTGDVVYYQTDPDQ